MKKILLLIFFLFIVGILSSDAQCPMCRAAVESGMDEEHSKGKGLNDGILYLLATPYIAIAVVGRIWYRRNNKK